MQENTQSRRERLAIARQKELNSQRRYKTMTVIIGLAAIAVIIAGIIVLY